MYIQLLFVVIYLFFAKRSCKENSFLNKTVFFFVALYGGQLLLAIADPYKYYSINITTIILFNLQIVLLLLGVSVAYNRFGRFVNLEIPRIFDVKINKAVLFIQLLTLLLAFLRYQRMSSLIMSMDELTDSARGLYFTDLYTSYTEKLLNDMVGAFGIVSYFFSFGLLFFHQKKLEWKEWFMIISGFGVIVLDTMSSLGRVVIFNIIVVFIMFYFLSSSYDKQVLRKRVRPAAFILIGIVASVLAYATMVRTNVEGADLLLDNADQLIVEPFVSYFYVPICAFEYGSNHIFGDLVPMMGAADLAAPIDLLITPFQAIDHSIKGINDILGERMTPRFSFPSGDTWNALFTGASNYYIDFGLLGFIIFPFIHGYLLVSICRKSKSSGAWFIVFLFLFMSSFKHLVSSNIQSMTTVFSMLWIWYMKKTHSIT